LPAPAVAQEQVRYIAKWEPHLLRRFMGLLENFLACQNGKHAVVYDK